MTIILVSLATDSSQNDLQNCNVFSRSLGPGRQVTSHLKCFFSLVTACPCFEIRPGLPWHGSLKSLALLPVKVERAITTVTEAVEPSPGAYMACRTDILWSVEK